MSPELIEFYKEFFQDIHGAADADGRYAEASFFDVFCEQLVAAGELETADHTPHAPPRGLRVDGYGGDPAGAEGVLSLIISDFHQSDEIGRLTATDMDAIFKRLSNFLSRSLEPSFRNAVEESDPGFGLADLIASRWPQISKVRLFLISNRILSARVDGREGGEFKGVPVTYSVWDLERLYRFVATGHGREDIDIDFEGDFGGTIAALPAHLSDASYEAYLLVIPGHQLAAIYDKWGARLLEQNVRVFLQARGGVNKGIRTTLEESPQMFFAYNNGITATAESITLDASKSGLFVRQIKNLQIVNGGQTTASVHAASRKKENHLAKVFVQMKLSVIPPSEALDVVPKISEFANSQNRVNAADFFANHPFHIQMEKFSRRIYAPSPDGTFRETKWYYERARGQYQDERALRTVAQRKKFDLEYPKRNLVEKTDLAKYLNVWNCHPDIVSRGAQKNFAQFAKIVGAEWNKDPDRFNERYYRHAIAKAIVFSETEKLVTEQPWYEGGYRANVVAYAISKIAHDVAQSGHAIDFDRIWKDQGVSSAMRDALVLASEAVHGVIVAPPAGMKNVTEWAKQQACWNRTSALSISWPQAFTREWISEKDANDSERDGIKDQHVLNGIEAQTIVVSAGGSFWRTVKEWGVSKRLLSPTEAGILDVASMIPAKVPSDKQCAIAVAALKRLHGEGCQIGRELF